MPCAGGAPPGPKKVENHDKHDRRTHDKVERVKLDGDCHVFARSRMDVGDRDDFAVGSDWV